MQCVKAEGPKWFAPLCWVPSSPSDASYAQRLAYYIREKEQLRRKEEQLRRKQEQLLEKELLLLRAQGKFMGST